MNCILEWLNVGFNYEGGGNALININTKIFENESIAVIGSNGAGKSTFFLGCIGIIRPKNGNIKFCGTTLKYSKNEIKALRSQVGLVFQDPDVQMIAPTVLDEVAFGPMNLGFSKEDAYSIANLALKEWGIYELRKKPPHYLSGGEKKRVSLSDILVMNPRLLLLDEPTASLDGKNALYLKQKLFSLSQQGMSIMVATHDMDFVWEWAKRVIVFDKGCIVADNTPEDVFKNDELIHSAGINKPMILATLQEICKIKNIPLPIVLPKNQQDLALWLQTVLL